MDFQWQCPVCQKVIADSNKVGRHKKSHKETNYRCKNVPRNLLDLVILRDIRLHV